MNNFSLHSKILGTFLATAVAPWVAASAGDWAQYRGPGSSARAVDFNVPPSWPGELATIWKKEIGDGVATPALVDDRIFTFSREEPYEVIRCLDAKTGEEVWQEKYETLAPTGGARNYAGPRSSPAVAEGMIVTYGVRGTLNCSDATTGKVVWRKEGGSGAWPQFYTSSSPIILNGLCIVQLGSDDKGSISAFNLQTGELKWAWDDDGATYASPVVANLGGKDLIVAQSTKRVVALDAMNGELLWETPFATSGREINSVTPIVDGDKLIYTGTGRGIHAVKFSMQDGNLSGTKLWSTQENSMKFSNPVLFRGALLGINEGGQLFCVDAVTGKTAWTVSTSGAAASEESGGGRRRRGGGGFGSVLTAGDVAIAVSPSSEMIVFEPQTSGYVELARIKLSDSPVQAYPIPSGNRLFVKDQNSIALLQLD